MYFALSKLVVVLCHLVIMWLVNVKSSGCPPGDTFAYCGVQKINILGSFRYDFVRERASHLQIMMRLLIFVFR